MIKTLPAFILILLLCMCSSTKQGQAIPPVKDDKLTYVNKGGHISLELPKIKGWTTGVPSEDFARNIVFGAVHVGKIINLILSIEPLNSDLEDYYILVKKANDFEKRSGFKKMALDTFTLNGEKALKFTYMANVVSIDSALLNLYDSLANDSTSDSLVEEDTTTYPSPYKFTAYVYTNIFMKYDEFNYWLEVSTLEEGYDRRKPFIDELIKGLKILK